MKRIISCIVGIIIGVCGWSQNMDDATWTAIVEAYDSGNIELVRSLAMPFANKGDVDALYVMACSYEDTDFDLFFEWLVKAAKHKHKTAQTRLGLIYLNGQGVNQDINEGIGWLIKGAERDYQAQYFLGRIYLYGDFGIEEDLEKARYYYKQASDRGFPPAMTQTALFILSIDGSRDEARELFEKAIKAGDNENAPVLLADNFYKDTEDRWFRLYRVAADNGNDIAQCKMGDCFLEGKFVDIDYKEALNWYKKSAEAGNPNAQARVGECYKKLFAKTLDERYLKQYIRWSYKASEFNVGTYIFNEDSKVLEFVDEFKQYYEEGYLNAAAYLDYDSWREKVVKKIAEGSDIDSDIPSVKRQSNAYALIIANEEYEYEVNVPYAESDGSSFKRYCTEVLGVPDSHILFISNAGLNKMRYEINRVSDICIANNASLYVYYAGHGIPADDLSASYILPVDGYSNDTSSGIDLKDVYNALASIPSTVIIDACFSGATRQGDMLQNTRGVRVCPNIAVPGNKTVVISACQANETAYGDDVEGHGLFTYFLLKKLKETRGNVTLGDLYDYVSINVKQAAMKDNKAQNPSISTSEEMKNNWRKASFAR